MRHAAAPPPWRSEQQDVESAHRGDWRRYAREAATEEFARRERDRQRMPPPSTVPQWLPSTPKARTPQRPADCMRNYTREEVERLGAARSTVPRLPPTPTQQYAHLSDLRVAPNGVIFGDHWPLHETWRKDDWDL